MCKELPDEPDYYIKRWLRTQTTVDFLGVWEENQNPNFKPTEFGGIGMEAGTNTFSLSNDEIISY